MLGPAHQRFPFLFAAFISQQQMYANRGGYLPAAAFSFLFLFYFFLSQAGWRKV
jgi:hypothetical protein